LRSLALAAVAVAVFACGIAGLPWDGALSGVQPGTSFASGQQPDQKQLRSDAQPIAVTTVRRNFPPAGLPPAGDTGPAFPAVFLADTLGSTNIPVSHVDRDAPPARPISSVRSRAPPVLRV